MQFLAGVWNFLPFRKVAFAMRTTQLLTSVCRRGFFHWVQVAGMWSCTSTPPYASMACTGASLRSAVHMVFNGQCLIPIGGKQFAVCHHVRIGFDPSKPFVQWVWRLDVNLLALHSVSKGPHECIMFPVSYDAFLLLARCPPKIFPAS